MASSYMAPLELEFYIKEETSDDPILPKLDVNVKEEVAEVPSLVSSACTYGRYTKVDVLTCVEEPQIIDDSDQLNGADTNATGDDVKTHLNANIGALATHGREKSAESGVANDDTGHQSNTVNLPLNEESCHEPDVHPSDMKSVSFDEQYGSAATIPAQQHNIIEHFTFKCAREGCTFLSWHFPKMLEHLLVHKERFFHRQRCGSSFYGCSLCSKGLASWLEFVVHKCKASTSAIRDGRLYYCKFCSLRFGYLVNLKNHLASEHGFTTSGLTYQKQSSSHVTGSSGVTSSYSTRLPAPPGNSHEPDDHPSHIRSVSCDEQCGSAARIPAVLTYQKQSSSHVTGSGGDTSSYPMLLTAPTGNSQHCTIEKLSSSAVAGIPMDENGITTSNSGESERSVSMLSSTDNCQESSTFPRPVIITSDSSSERCHSVTDTCEIPHATERLTHTHEKPRETLFQCEQKPFKCDKCSSSFKEKGNLKKAHNSITYS